MLNSSLIKFIRKFFQHCQQATSTSSKAIHGSSSLQREFKVSVLGACGSVGKPLSLLLKHSELISELYLYDVMGTAGIACDLSHIETKANVTGYIGSRNLRESLKGSDVVMIAAGSAWRSVWTQSEILEINAPIVKEFAHACAYVCPNALIAVITSPIDTLVPIVSQVFQKYGVYDPRKIFGMSTLNVVRANTFIARFLHLNPLAIDCPVIGGNFGTSIVPLISKCKPCHFDEISDEHVRNITQHIQNASRSIEEAKAGKGATLSMAYAGARFANSLLKGLSGELDIVECAFVRSDVVDCKYFSSEVRLNEDGVDNIKQLSSKMSNFEKELLQNAVPQVIQSVELGEKWLKMV